MAEHSYHDHPAYMDGARARLAGQSEDTNPHDAGDWRTAPSRWAWFWGWQDRQPRQLELSL